MLSGKSVILRTSLRLFALVDPTYKQREKEDEVKRTSSSFLFQNYLKMLKKCAIIFIKDFYGGNRGGIKAA